MYYLVSKNVLSRQASAQGEAAALGHDIAIYIPFFLRRLKFQEIFDI